MFTRWTEDQPDRGRPEGKEDAAFEDEQYVRNEAAIDETRSSVHAGWSVTRLRVGFLA